MIIAIIVSLIVGILLARYIDKVCLASYFIIKEARTKKASIDIARVILNGKYLKMFNNKKY